MIESHGPARVADFAWWAGLTLGDARLGLSAVESSLVAVAVGAEPHWTVAKKSNDIDRVGRVHLLPGFDEMLLGYQDRSASLAKEHAVRIVPGGNGMFRPTVIDHGRVVGTWSRVASKRRIRVHVEPFERLPRGVRAGVDAAAARYGAFLGLDVDVSIA